VKADVEAAPASGSVPTATLSPLHQEKAPSPFLLEESASNPAQAGNEVTHHTTPGPPSAPFVPASAPAGLTPGAVEKLETAKGSDHRILYGADGAQFLARVRGLLEEPVGLAL